MSSKSQFILSCKQKILSGGKISVKEATDLFNIPDSELHILSDYANEITRKFNGSKVDVEQLTNIKKNYCSEDCSFCSQSAFFNTKIASYELPPAHEIVDQARKAKDNGADSFCLVAAWREPSPSDFEKVCRIISQINEKVNIKIDCSLGFLNHEQAKQLKDLKVHRYNHNLETSRSKFPEICTTHTYDDRINTLKIARKAGLQLCTGGILGLGETRKQRLELILELMDLVPEEVTINLLVPITGTPLELQKPLSVNEILRVFSVLRFVLPSSLIKLSGGREINLEDDGQQLLLSGANGIISAGYLTINGNETKKDLEMIKKIGIEA